MSGSYLLRPPEVGDASRMWHLVNRSENLDRNSLYSYLMWCRDFSESSVVAEREDGEVIGFITGYRRQEVPDVLFAWQTAADPEDRRPGLPGAMLETLLRRAGTHGVTHLETTVNPGNRPVIMMLEKFASDTGASVERSTLFDASQFPDGHPSEVLYRIGPIRFSSL
ncbi:diaminobutyrate acetyltransferase [Streptomyces sp. NRRL S-37]|uniref:diaminobutyrate acetyltransferase n=1 Tax=Streptomyces sp. NRRL S-37 TaxID=1463903 RepID=UPI00068DF405|nr:diaminobutyrate acetyltransferase [Streptomyces sp. NRRL S-37]